MIRSALHGLATSLVLNISVVLAQPTPEPPLSSLGAPASFANRETLAWWYLEVDKAWEAARAGKDAAGVREAHEAFDAATLLFFKLDLSGAVVQLAQLRQKLTAPDSGHAAMPIALQVEPRVWTPANTEPRLRLRSAESAPAPGDVTLLLEARTPAGELLLHHDCTVDRGMLARGEVVVSGINWMALRDRVRSAAAAPGAREVPLTVHWTVSRSHGVDGADRMIVSPWSLAQRKAELIKSLDEIEATANGRTADLRIARSRAALLTDSPNRNKASEFLADYSSLLGSLDSEVDQIRRGSTPYPLEGTWWTTVRSGKVTAPLWFSAPGERRSGRPLLVVFHGAGGDESMFIYGYGQGTLVREAVERGMVVVSPATGATMGSPRLFEAIVMEAIRLYGVDPSRISVAGHSMGAGAVSSLAQRYPTQLAGAVCFAGGNFDPSKASCPTLMLAGEIDPIIPGTRLEVGAKPCIDAGLPLTFTLCRGNGHTFIVGDQRRAALDFLGERRSQVPFVPREAGK